MNRRLMTMAAGAPILVFIVVYAARAGHGFLIDDFTWIVNSRVRSLADIGRLFSGAGGFYRPMVALTFAANEWMFGSSPLGYGLTNVALALLCGAAIFYLARACALSSGASMLAAVLWLMNFHVTNMSIMWISGRTALLVVIFAALAATNVLRGRLMAAIACLALALLSKEEAVLLPFILAAWLFVLQRRTGRAPIPVVRWIAASAAVVSLYLIARSFTIAMTPATAPSYYQFRFDASSLFWNAAEYADRTSTLAIAVAIAAAAVLGWPRAIRDAETKATLWCGAVWLVGALGFAYVLPVRSDLYAAVPAIGASLVAAAVVHHAWRGSTDARRRRALVAAILLPLILAPVYWDRTQRRARFAEFSEAVLTDLVALTRALPPGARVLIDDIDPNPGVRPATMAATFGAALGDAYDVRAGYRLDLALRSESSADEPAPAPAMTLAVRDGRLHLVETGK